MIDEPDMGYQLYDVPAFEPYRECWNDMPAIAKRVLAPFVDGTAVRPSGSGLMRGPFGKGQFTIHTPEATKTPGMFEVIIVVESKIEGDFYNVRRLVPDHMLSNIGSLAKVMFEDVLVGTVPALAAGVASFNDLIQLVRHEDQEMRLAAIGEIARRKRA